MPIDNPWDRFFYPTLTLMMDTYSLISLLPEIRGPIHQLHSYCHLVHPWELSGRVHDLRPRSRGFEPHRRHSVVPLSKNFHPSLVLVQPRKTRPFITERLLMGRKESNQTNKQN